MPLKDLEAALNIARENNARGGMPKMHIKKPKMGKIHVGPIHSQVAGRTDHLNMHVKSGSYVIPADIISAMGEGNTMAGFRVAKNIFSQPAPHRSKTDVRFLVKFILEKPENDRSNDEKSAFDYHVHTEAGKKLSKPVQRELSTKRTSSVSLVMLYLLVTCECKLLLIVGPHFIHRSFRLPRQPCLTNTSQRSKNVPLQ